MLILHVDSILLESWGGGVAGRWDGSVQVWVWVWVWVLVLVLVIFNGPVHDVSLSNPANPLLQAPHGPHIRWQQ